MLIRIKTKIFPGFSGFLVLGKRVFLSLPYTMDLYTEAIQSWRRKRNMPQDYVADVLHISRPQYSKMERGEKPITIQQLVEIAKLVHVSPVTLFIEIISNNGHYKHSIPNGNENGNVTVIDYEDCLEQLKFYKKLAEINDQKYMDLYRRYIEKCSEHTDSEK